MTKSGAFALGFKLMYHNDCDANKANQDFAALKACSLDNTFDNVPDMSDTYQALAFYEGRATAMRHWMEYQEKLRYYGG